MPNYFTLTKKGESDPTTLGDIDREICALFGVPEDPKRFYRGWYDSIGLGISVGFSWDRQREIIRQGSDPDGIKDEALRIVGYLEEHYVANAWYSPR